MSYEHFLTGQPKINPLDKEIDLVESEQASVTMGGDQGSRVCCNGLRALEKQTQTLESVSKTCSGDIAQEN